MTTVVERPRRFGFPNPVNEVAARVVAAGVLIECVVFLATRQPVVVAVIAYGFVARVLAGPRYSPLGLLATRIVVPRLGVRPKLVPGPPKRFAQSIGATLSVAALVASLLGATGLAMLLVAAIVMAATLESALAFCIGCRIFAILMRAGVIPESVCEACNRLPA
jgi:Domain of unknown function (DUF4395)